MVERLSDEYFDLLVIGGGIAGAGIAMDAASRGLRVALVEMQDYAAGASSRSTKPIQGGEPMDLQRLNPGRMREAGREWAILHRNAGHLVQPGRMMVPIVKGGRSGRLRLKWRLWLYDRLAGVPPSARSVMLGREKAVEREPWIHPGLLQGAGICSTYQVDGARLVMEVAKTAAEQGALLLNYAKVVAFSYDGGRIDGAIVHDEIGGQSFQIRARQAVNAAGPWVDELRKMNLSLHGSRMYAAKGVHLVLHAQHLPVRHSISFDAGDGRMIFAVPRANWIHVGTTGTRHEGSLEHPQVTAEEADYLIAALNRMFPRAALERSHIESSWAGLRPLAHPDGKAASLFRKGDELLLAKSGLVTVVCDNLTGFRKLAERVVDLIVGRMRTSGLPSITPQCETARIPLTGSRYPSVSDKDGQVSRLALKYGVAEEELEWLQGLFGSEAEAVLILAEGRDKLSVLRGALLYCIQNEGVMRMGDFFIRRTAMLYFGRKWINPSLETARAVFAEVFGDGYDPDPGGEFADAYRQAATFE
ncbi:MAG: glycerol-3-phosphate dehydrogenase [Bacteroidota bacterium]